MMMPGFPFNMDDMNMFSQARRNRSDRMDLMDIIRQMMQMQQGVQVPVEHPLEQDIYEALPEMDITDLSKIPAEKKNCVICLTDFVVNDKAIILPCTHLFHSACIKSWLQSNDTCPICKYKINRNDLG